MSSLSQLSAGPATRFDRVTAFPRATILVCVALVAAALFAGILIRNGGQFAYTLDAPYTHMALADHILQGTYGLNAGEPASPSSSILYPFLLALLSFLPIGQFSALLVCILATFATALLVYAVAEEVGIEVERLSTFQLGMITIAATLAFNLVGLAFAGLEHSLHVTLTIASLLGLLRFVRRQQVDWWWLVAITLLPLIRFEAAAALAADMVVLIAFGKWRHALAVGAIGALGIVCFGLFLHSLGLPVLPSSVLSRSAVASSGIGLAEGSSLTLVKAIYSAFRANLVAYGGTLISIFIVAALYGMARGAIPSRFGERDWAKPAAVGFFVVIALAQLLGGSLSSFSRYEIYVLMLGICALMVAWQPEVNGFLRNISWLRCIALCGALLFLFSGYVFRTIDAVSASGNVHDQQYQMNRFIVGYWRQPYAANHPGWVNWRNPHYMLELSGLGSEDARQVGAAPGWADDLARRHNVGLAMLYDNATPAAPAGWQPIARLLLRERVVTAVGPSVTFYATRPDEVVPIRAALNSFAPSLPHGAVLDMMNAR